MLSPGGKVDRKTGAPENAVGALRLSESVRGMVWGPACQIFLGSCLPLLTGDGPAKQVGPEDVPMSPPRPSPCGKSCPLDFHFLLLCRYPTSGMRSVVRFVDTTRSAPAERCWLPVSGSGASARVLRFGLDRSHLTHRLSDGAALRKHPRNLEKVLTLGSFPRPTPPPAL